MANIKKGFIYYSVDTNRYQDIKIKKLKKNFGRDGVAIYDYILCEIYREKGCFIVWDESTAFDVADYWEVNENQLTEIVNYCCTVGLFHRELLVRDKMLSSKAILTRFIDWSKKAKRSDIKIPEKLNFLMEESEIIQEESPQPSGSLPQSKVKESKEEKSKVKPNGIPVSDETDTGEVKIQYKKLIESISGKELVLVTSSLKAFIAEKRPVFIDPYQEYWNLFAKYYGLAQVDIINDNRKKKFKTRISEPAFDFLKILDKIKVSNMLRGVDTNSSWKVTFDWVFENQNNYVKILEGNYDGN
ncbi:MAG: DUF4373 domain-containing protein [Chitinophagales bacterium]|nr:DUF4373 domain-containing protein [Chitinophagales bacterium]MBP9845806.1 DUF4373 domain-containing protein [Saprospiraceae bacterium]